MSHSSRPRERGSAPRRCRDISLEAPQTLEERRLLTPVLPLVAEQATFTPAANPTNADLGTVSITPVSGTNAYPSDAPLTSVSQLAPASEFGGDIVRIKAGPGGVFGSGVYAISRGAGENAGAVNRPGVIYRVDPATGKASVFFDLNTVISQLEPGGNASNSVGAQTDLVNWYDIAFDPEGYFDGRPSMFVTSVDQSDANKNAIYRIGPDGSFMGAFVQFTGGQPGVNFVTNPTSIVVPPPEDQTFLRGLVAGTTASTSQAAGTFTGLFFDANAYKPGQVINSSALPTGVSQTALTNRPIVGLTAANPDYTSRVYDVFTNFGTPGFSGVQGINGDVLMLPPPGAPAPTQANPLPPDQTAFETTPFRRFQDIAFDQYGYFSQGIVLPATTSNGVTTFTLTRSGIPQPVNVGSLFVTDLAAGFQVTVTPLAPLPTSPVTIPIQTNGGTVSVTMNPTTGNVVGSITGGANFGGRIIRILPSGVATVFAANFHTSGSQGPDSFFSSSLSISFSADGTTLYASDDDGIWQFKTVASLAGSSSGSIVGLNDLRSLGVPYEGQDSAVAIVDSGVDALSPPFRGRVAPGNNVITNGFGNVDTSAGFSGTTTTATTTTTTGTVGNTTILTGVDGHGTLVAGVVAQFVPQATLDPVNIFSPFLAFTSTTSTTTTTGTTGATVTTNSNALASTNDVYKGFDYVAKHPFVNDPVRPNKTDRVIAATYGFGTTETFDSEGSAYRRYPQIVIAFKNELKKYRKLGIAPIAASGQFGAPFAAGISSVTTTTGTTASGTNNVQNANIGDVNGISFPAILNEVISVTGTIPFPYSTGPEGLPTQPPSGIFPGANGPLLVTIGPTGIGNITTTGGNIANGNLLSALTAGNSPPGTNVTNGNNFPVLFSDRILAAANRNVTTDFGAPAIDIPTFRRLFSVNGTTTNPTNGTTTVTINGQTIDPTDHLTFQQGGTSLSAGIVSGAYALVSSALDYWSKLNVTGVTSDAYLTQPVGARTLNFGPHAFKDLSAYNNPDGINAIFAWTAVPAADSNDSLSQSSPPYLLNSTHFRQFARINVANAIAAVEGTIALQYLLDHNIFPIIDANHDGIVTAHELQTFVDNSAAMGMPEAGAMARLLGGTARPPGEGFTFFGEQPDQPDVLQRRFNFFDYVADGQLNGSVTIDQLKMLAHTLLPKPDAFVINNRPKASTNGFLVDPTAHRNFQDLQHIKPTYQFVPARAFLKYRGLPPDRFTVNRLGPGDTLLNQFPVYELFSNTPSHPRVIQNSAPTPSNNNSSNNIVTLTTGGQANTGSASASTTGPSGAMGNTAEAGASASVNSTATANTNPSTDTTGVGGSTTSPTSGAAGDSASVNATAMVNTNTGTGTTGAGGSTVGSSTTSPTSGTSSSNVANPQGVTDYGKSVVNTLIQSLQGGGSIGAATPAGSVGPVVSSGAPASTSPATTTSNPPSTALPQAVPLTIAPTSAPTPVVTPAPALPQGPVKAQTKAKQKK
jgi:hypothetical protein